MPFPDVLSYADFGFMDGISQPAVSGFVTNPTPGQAIVNPGVILVGETGDAITRPDWAKDGSFLAFRQLKQLVPEFESFLTANPLNVSGLTPEQGSALLGARMVGRWKSVRRSAVCPRCRQTHLSSGRTRRPCALVR